MPEFEPRIGWRTANALRFIRSERGPAWWRSRAPSDMEGLKTQYSALPKHKFYNQCTVGKEASLVHPACTRPNLEMLPVSDQPSEQY